MITLESTATIALDTLRRKTHRLEIRSGGGLKLLPVGRWVKPPRTTFNTRALMGVSGDNLLLLVAPEASSEAADRAAVHQLAPLGTVTWFDDCQCSILKSPNERPPLFKFVLRNTTAEGLVGAAATAHLQSLLRPRRCPLQVAVLDQNYLFTLKLGEPHVRRFQQTTPD